MTRKQALQHIFVAGTRNDVDVFVRMYVENRISYESALAAFQKGKAAALKFKQGIRKE